MLAALALVSCTSGDRSAVDGGLVFDGIVALVRGEQIDSARTEFAVDQDATYVAIVYEDDTDVKVSISHAGARGVSGAAAEIDSSLEGGGIEIAVLDAPAGSRLTVALEGPPHFDRPGKARLKLMRYDKAAAQNPRVDARLAAFRAWSAATGARLTGEELRTTALRDIDAALAHLESAEGDPSMAAWGRMVRSKMNYRQFTNLRISLADAEHAERGFAALGASQDVARARINEAAVLIELVPDKTAKAPDAQEAARRAKQLLLAVSTDPASSALQRARAVNYLGVLAFYVYDVPEARARFLAVIPAFEAIGQRQGRLMAYGNLAALANEAGDYRAATRYYDQVIQELFRFNPIGMRTMMLVNASTIDLNAGNVDNAIEKLMRAQEMMREHKLMQHEARILHGLGYAYWVRGDTAQATVLLGEALKLRRKVDDLFGLVGSLRVNGSLARDAGDIQRALLMHREAASRTSSADAKVNILLELALDQQAASDFPRAIATAREALAVRVDVPNFYKRYAVQLALADMLLAQPGRTTRAVSEAEKLTRDSLDAAILRADTTQEIAARRLLAQSHVASGDLNAAREEYERAIELIFKYRGTINNPELRATTLAHEQKTFRGYVDLLMRDVARRGPGKLMKATAAEEDALRILEWARAINFDSTRVSNLGSANQARLDELLTQMAGKRVRIAALLDRTEDVTRELEVLRLDIAQLRAEVDRLRTTAARAAGTVDDSLAVGARWPQMQAGVTQLSYAFETRHAYLWVRDASGIRSTVLAVAPGEIERDVAALAAANRGKAPHQLEKILGRLSTALLPPGALARQSTTLEIVAEGRAATVPFAALAGQHSIVMIGSMFEARARPRPVQPRPLALLALASDSRSKGDESAARVFPVLQNAGAEARAVAAQFELRSPPVQVRLMFGADGTADNLEKSWRRGVDVVHFATHGLADLRQPLASLLLLPALDATGSPTYLTAGQVQEWRGDADLVYLSACETAVGPARFAEGLPGLQRAFLRAGARGVIATLWPVEDVYASQFAADFYRRYTAGMPASQALSETQRAWMEPAPGIRESEQGYRRMTAWAHAYYSQ